MCFSFKTKIDIEELKKIFNNIDFSHLKNTSQTIYPNKETCLITSNGILKRKWGIKLNFISKKLINIRSETLYQKFPNYSRNKACIPIESFFEWYTTPLGQKKQVEFFPNSKNPFLAAIYNEESFAILTKESPKEIHHIHSRVPCIFDENNIKTFLREDLNIHRTINSFFYTKP